MTTPEPSAKCKWPDATDNMLQLFAIARELSNRVITLQNENHKLERENEELLEALRAALPVMEARAPDFNIVNDAIRAAIAKAEGKT